MGALDGCAVGTVVCNDHPSNELSGEINPAPDAKTSDARILRKHLLSLIQSTSREYLTFLGGGG